MGVCGECHAPAALPPGKTWYPLYRKLGGPQAQCLTLTRDLKTQRNMTKFVSCLLTDMQKHERVSMHRDLQEKFSCSLF
jgi:hypothetical protein